eukprot:scaffold46953_cov62-Phaeocystis_antarctica.AAC.12
MVVSGGDNGSSGGKVERRALVDGESFEKEECLLHGAAAFWRGKLDGKFTFGGREGGDEVSERWVGAYSVA